MTNFKVWMEQKKDYAVVMVRIPESLAQKINQFSNDHIPDEKLYTKGKDYGREKESHITVLYGLKDKDIDQVKTLLRKIHQFPIHLGPIEKFSNKDEYDVIKIPILGEELFRANLLLKHIDHHSTYNEFKPHCTLAYVQKGSCDDLIGNDFFVETEFKVKRMDFVDTDMISTSIALH
jgi:2'-5' RNA ligase